MISPSECQGPVLCQSDGCWYCPRRPYDETFDCDACRAEEQDAADRANDMAGT